jgi:hypothetical protein
MQAGLPPASLIRLKPVPRSFMLIGTVALGNRRIL